MNEGQKKNPKKLLSVIGGIIILIAVVFVVVGMNRGQSDPTDSGESESWIPGAEGESVVGNVEKIDPKDATSESTVNESTKESRQETTKASGESQPKGETASKSALTTEMKKAGEKQSEVQPSASTTPIETMALTSMQDAEIPKSQAPQTAQELKGMWISYLELNDLPKEQTAFQKAINQMYDNCVSLGMNAVFVHVRPDSDAMYPSSYFPWSKFASGKQGVNPGYDPLAYMIEAAHARGLKFHAWINPYRVTGYLVDWTEVADNNPAKVWMTDADTSNDRWVLLHSNYYYYNPSIPQVRELIVNGIKEIVDNYNVDGIHFDDYFYPTLDNNNAGLWFDKPEYDASNSQAGITAWRRDNVNQLIRSVYSTVKASKPNVEFGVSPAGYVANLRSDSKLFVDIDTWMSNTGYVDYIMPQLYWGFENKTSKGDLAPYAYDNNLQTWIDLKNKGNVKLYIGLATSRAGTNVADNNSVSEWLRKDDILKRMVETGRNSGQVGGYCFFSYRSFYTAEASKEVANLSPILK